MPGAQFRLNLPKPFDGSVHFILEQLGSNTQQVHHAVPFSLQYPRFNFMLSFRPQ